MKFLLLAAVSGLFLFGCVSKNQVAEALRENPELLYEAMKKDPEKFMITLQEVAQAAQSGEGRRQMMESRKQMEDDFKNPRAVQIDANRLVYGEAGAPVTIVKYADFQCPACRMGFESLEEVKKKYGSKIRMIHKNVPLRQIHPQAQLAAEIYEALIITNKPKAQAFYKIAYQEQGSWKSEKEVWALAKKIGADKAKIQAEIKKGEVGKRIKQDEEEHAKLGFQGTPTYMVNGVALEGAQSPQQLGYVIDRVSKK